MSATIKDVARLAGVSPSTVSRVLSKSSRISEETSKRVRTIMEDLGYTPNSLAKSLASRESNTICVVLPKPAEELFTNMFFPELIRGIVTQASRSGYDVLLTAEPTERKEIDTLSRLLEGKRADGAILLYSRKDDQVIEFLSSGSHPFVLIGKSESHPEILTVDNDNVKAANDAVMHLIAMGHTRIGFVSGPQNLVVSQDRLKGYLAALENTGYALRPEWIVEGDFLQESGYRAMSFFMDLQDRPSALVVSDDLMALGILRGLKEAQYSVPEDICLVSFNNIPPAALSHPPLTSVDIGIYQLGYAAAQTLVYRIRHAPDEKSLPFPARQIIPHQLIVRESSLRHLPLSP
ncbi:LacI family DNA-binding transcriptional regulator [Gorillibacterium timonense]|uniref:LacI family DNA-binding transcriptional regulator n=1 Tax=Gorillibacterium timonense TaxID=1689269 RepID=UPI00071CCF86|nr:LacI family DNA-binding transcriptional regulator [Gorillibacterium timonense]